MGRYEVLKNKNQEKKKCPLRETDTIVPASELRITTPGGYTVFIPPRAVTLDCPRAVTLDCYDLRIKIPVEAARIIMAELNDLRFGTNHTGPR
jgi:hypothetical protein